MKDGYNSLVSALITSADAEGDERIMHAVFTRVGSVTRVLNSIFYDSLEGAQISFEMGHNFPFSGKDHGIL